MKGVFGGQGQNPNTNRGYGQTNPRTVTTNYTNSPQVPCPPEESRIWYIYQAKRTDFQFSVEISDEHIANLLANYATILALVVPPGTQLQPFDKIFLWNPETDTLIPVDHSSDLGVNTINPMLNCRGIWTNQTQIVSADRHTAQNRPFIAKGFRLVGSEKLPKFKDGEDALRWMESNL